MIRVLDAPPCRPTRGHGVLTFTCNGARSGHFSLSLVKQLPPPCLPPAGNHCKIRHLSIPTIVLQVMSLLQVKVNTPCPLGGGGFKLYFIMSRP